MTAWSADRLRTSLRLYLLADSAFLPADQLPAAVASALRSGASSVQLRGRGASTIELLELARELRALCADGHVPFVVNERVDSAHEARLATSHGASYVSAGPMFSTSSAPNSGETLLRSVRAATGLPVVVVGGVNLEHAGALYAAGADGLCVGRAILRANDIEAAARAFLEARGGGQ